MDERDIKLLMAIAKLGTDSPTEIHENTGIPESTIYYRLDKLRQQGIIKNDLKEVDKEEIGLDITIIIDIIATYEEGYHKSVGERLKEIEGVSEVYFTMGETDFVAIAHVAERETVERLIADFEAIDEVQRTQSKFVISTIKYEPHVLKNYSFETFSEEVDSSES